MTFYAKPDQTYREHIEAVHLAWKETVRAKMPLIERMANRYNFSVERFLKGSLLTITLHDIGKMIEPFQKMMMAVKQNKPFDKKTNYRHELISFISTAKYWHVINNESYLTCTPSGSTGRCWPPQTARLGFDFIQQRMFNAAAKSLV